MLPLKIAISVCLILGAANLSTQQCLSDNDIQTISKSDKADLYRGQQAFTVSLMDAINKATPNDNVFFSPYSTYHALLLAYFGAKNETKNELRKALRLEWAPSKNHVFQAYRSEKRIRFDRAKDSSIEFSAADKIYFSHQTEVRDCMKTFLKDELEPMDFYSDPEARRSEINSWIAGITKNEIPEILAQGDISQNTNLVLANAAYFKGQWESKFDPSDTTKEIFYTSSDKHTFVDMMFKRGQFNLGINEKLGAHVLEMPYLSGEKSKISMVILLTPFVTNGLDKILKDLTPETLHAALNDGMARDIEVKLPKFEFEQKIELVPVLSQMGIKSLFTPSADLSGFSSNSNFTLDDAKHVAKIKVDEEGSTAAAATVLFSFRSARPIEPTKFICDHPFVFLIYDHKSQAVLFAGIYRDPKTMTN
ncbi:hypothetical protein ACFFRR_000570 [Megaselia abdita]